MMKIVSGLSEQVLTDYQSNLAAKSGNKYTISATPAAAADWFITLLTYSVKNAEKFGTYYTSALTNFSEEEMITLGLDPTMRQVYIGQIQNGISELKANQEASLAQIAAMSGPANEFVKMFDGSEYTVTIEKNSGADF